MYHPISRRTMLQGVGAALALPWLEAMTQQVAYVLAKMKSLNEGDGSLLDHSMVLFGSSLKDGNRHDHHDLPLILAGRGNGTLQPGRRLRYKKDTPFCNLFVSMLNRMGIEDQKFGDSTGALANLG